MAKTFSEIKLVMTTQYLESAAIRLKYELEEDDLFEDTFSKLSIESILFDVLAFAILVFEQILDQHKTEVETLIFEQKIATDRWHRQKALDFQYGYDLITDSDQFDNGTATDEEIEESKIIKHSAVVQSESRSSIIVKIATEENELLVPVTDEIESAFAAYMVEVSPAITNFIVINQKADILVPTINIYRDPLVINENGMNILTGVFTVNNAITAYTSELNFNGQFIGQSLSDYLREVDGVVIVDSINMQTAAYNSVNEAYEDLEPINVRHTAVSGHFIVEDFTGITYVV